MLDEKEINIIKRETERLIREGKIIRGEKGKFTEFFINNSKNSFDSAKILFDISNNKELQKRLGYPGFNGYLWAINSSYYSMFYMTRALLEKDGAKIKSDQSIHISVFNALVYYFYLTGKIEKKIIEGLQEAGEEASELMGKEKTKMLINDYYNEKEKRGRFTYEMGEIAMQNKAETSLKRARIFNEEIRKMIEI